MSFSSRFPKVAALLGANANEDEQRRDEGDEDQTGEGSGEGGSEAEGGEGGDGGEGGAQGEGAGGEQDQGGEGGSEAEASLANLAAADRAALRDAFTRDANAQVAAERARCIAAFTSDAGRRSPNAAARLLNRTAMSSKDVIDTLGDMGATSRGQGRDRLNGSAETRVETGAAQEQAAGREAVLDERKKARGKRNAAAMKRGAVRANRTEFDARDDAAE